MNDCPEKTASLVTERDRSSAAASANTVDMRRGKIEFGDVGNRPYQVVLRVGELRRGLQGYRTCRKAEVSASV
jgi:hypothetical protein